MSALPILIIAPLLLFSFVSALAGIWSARLAFLSAAIGLLAALLAAGAGLTTVVTEGTLRHYLGGWPPPFGIEYVLDPLSAFMAIVIVFIAFVLIIYPPEAGYYQTPRRGVPLFALTLLLIAGLVGVVVTGDLFNLYVFLEIYSVASYALIGMAGKGALVASFRYLILGTIGGSFYLLGVGFIYFLTGSLNMADVARLLPPLYDSPAILAAVTLMVVGLAIKMALFPLHTWLPDAHSLASPVVAALLASVQVETAAYVLVRISLTVFQPEFFYTVLPVTRIVLWAAIVAIIYGSVMAIPQRDFKRMLAYSTVAQVGYIGVGIGLGNPLGLVGALLHILNHAFMKSCLFLVAGSIRHQTGTVDIPRFGGLGRRMPLTMAGFIVAALSMVGVPPTAGFFSKWYLVLGGADAGSWAAVAAILASSLLTAVYFFRMIENVYARSAEVRDTVEAPKSIVVPILILAAGIVVLGLMNTLIVTRVLELAVAPLSTAIGGR